MTISILGVVSSLNDQFFSIFAQLIVLLRLRNICLCIPFWDYWLIDWQQCELPSVLKKLSYFNCGHSNLHYCQAIGWKIKDSLFSQNICINTISIIIFLILTSQLIEQRPIFKNIWTFSHETLNVDMII